MASPAADLEKVKGAAREHAPQRTTDDGQPTAEVPVLAILLYMSGQVPGIHRLTAAAGPDADDPTSALACARVARKEPSH